MSQGTDFSTRPRRRQRPGSADLLLLSAAGLAVLVAAVSALGSWSDLRRAQGALQRTREELGSARSRAKALEPGTGGANAVLASRILLSREAPPQAVMAELSGLLPPDVRLDDVRLDYGARLSVELRVRARDAAAYDLFLERLAGSPRFVGVVPGDEARGRELTAVLRLSYREQGGL